MCPPVQMVAASICYNSANPYIVYLSYLVPINRAIDTEHMVTLRHSSSRGAPWTFPRHGWR